MSERTRLDDGDEPEAHGETMGAATEPSPEGSPSHEAYEPGAKLGRYIVLEELGAGGMGIVYAAYDPELDRKVAVKLLHGESPGSQESRVSQGRERLLREAQAMASLSHPHVIPVHDVGTHQGRVFVAMEFVDGPTLKAWVKSVTASPERPKWRPVLDMYLQAGEGLAAAHRAGLVHRDFKPENVLVGDGRARVLDFGLARRTADGTTEPLPIVDVLSAVRHDDTSLTQTGAIMGTPAYMSPEQHLGHQADARSDQFSYCVGLWEGIHGERPFGGDTRMLLAFQVTRGKLRNPPPETKVPPWLHAAIERGLQVDPEARWPDMDELLAALRHGLEGAARHKQSPGAWRGWAIAGTVAATIGIGAVWVVASSEDQVAACAGDEHQLEDVFGDEARVRYREAFDATELPFAGDTWKRTEEALDAWSVQWLEARVSTCADTHDRHRQSVSTLEKRLACLDRQRVGFDTLLGAYEDPGTELVTKAVELASSLPGPRACALPVEAQGLALPDPAIAERVETIRTRLSRIDALGEAGAHQEALALALETQAAARELNFRPLLAETRLSLGRLRVTQDPEAGFVDLRKAVEHAIATGHGEMMWRAANGLTHAAGVQLSRYDEGEVWGGVALASVARAPDPELAEARVRRTLCHLYGDRGQPKEAMPHCERALELAEKVWGSDHFEYAGTLNNLANASLAMRDYGEALELYQRALAIRVSHLGEAHPAVASNFNNLAAAHYYMGEPERAAELFERALDVQRQALGPDHLQLADQHNNLAIVCNELDRVADAETHAREGLRLYRMHFEDGHPGIAASLAQLARVHLAREELDQATTTISEAVRIAIKTRGEAHPDVFSHLQQQAEIAQARGDWSSARASLDHAANVAMLLDSAHPRVEDNWMLRAKLEIAAGDRTAAHVAALRLLELRVDRGAAQNLVDEAKGLVRETEDPR